MINEVEWLFFDVGSTLVNEEKVYMHRLHNIADEVREPLEKIYEKAINLYKENKKGDLELLKVYGLPKQKWYFEEEELYSEAIDCLEELSKKYKIGIIANQELGTSERLEKFGILKYIDLVIASAEEGVAKPDKRIFEIALERSGCKPENAVMIGDRIDNDIIPAKEIGMKTIWIRQGFGGLWTLSDKKEEPNKIVPNLLELRDCFRDNIGMNY